MSLLRSLVRSCVLLALLLAACMDGQRRRRLCGMRLGPEGAVWAHGWCRRIVRALRIACHVEGTCPKVGERGLALVSNHLSYLDILVYSAMTPLIIVSKAEVRGWPLIGWITAQAGTIYVQRGDVKGGQTQTHSDVNAAMAAAFASGLPVLFFPEGTTTDGAGVLPFRRGLFNSVVYGRVPVKAGAIGYGLDRLEDAAFVAERVCYWGEMEFGPHLFSCLGLRGLRAHVRFGSEEIDGDDRFALAVNARGRVMELYRGLAARESPVGDRTSSDPVVMDRVDTASAHDHFGVRSVRMVPGDCVVRGGGGWR